MVIIPSKVGSEVAARLFQHLIIHVVFFLFLRFPISVLVVFLFALLRVLLLPALLGEGDALDLVRGGAVGIEDGCELFWGKVFCDIIGVVAFLIWVLFIFVGPVVSAVVALFLILIVLPILLLLAPQVFSFFLIEVVLFMHLPVLLLLLDLVHGLDLPFAQAGTVDSLVDGDLAVPALHVVTAAQLGVQEVSEENELGVQKLSEHRYIIRSHHISHAVHPLQYQHIITAQQSQIILYEVDPVDLDDAPPPQLRALPVVLLEDRLNIADGIEPILLGKQGDGLAHLDRAGGLLAGELGHPPPVLHGDLLLEELAVDLVELVGLLAPPPALDVEAALEVLHLPLPLRPALPPPLPPRLRLLVLVRPQLRQDGLGEAVVGQLLPALAHVEGRPQREQVLGDLVGVLVRGRGLLEDLHELPPVSPGVHVHRAGELGVELEARLQAKPAVGLATLTVVLLLKHQVLHLLAFDLQRQFLRESELLGRLDVLLDPPRLANRLQRLRLTRRPREVLGDNGTQLADGFLAFDALDLLHVPGYLEEGGDLEDEEGRVLLVPQLDNAVLGHSEGGRNLEEELGSDDDLLLVRLLHPELPRRHLRLLLHLHSQRLQVEEVGAELVGLSDEGTDEDLLPPGVGEPAGDEFLEGEVEEVAGVVVKEEGGDGGVAVLQQVVAEAGEGELLQLVGQQVVQSNRGVVAAVQPLHYHYLVAVVQEDQQLVLRTVLVLDDHPLLRVVHSPREDDLPPVAHPALEVPELVEGVGVRHEGEVLGARAEGAGSDAADVGEVDRIDGVEIVIAVVADDEQRVLVEKHDAPHLLVEEGSHNLAHGHLLLVVLVLALRLLRAQEDLVEVVAAVDDEGRSPAADEEGRVARDVGGLCAEVLADLAEGEGEGEELAVDGEVELLLAGVEVVGGEEGVLDLALDGHLLQREVEQVGLEHHELPLRRLLDPQPPLLHLDYLPQTLLLVGRTGGLVQETQVVRVVADEDGLEVREDLEVSDHAVDGQRADLEGLVVAGDAEDSDRLLLPPRQVEGAPLLAELQVGDDLVVAETPKPHLRQRLVVEADLVAGHEADRREGDHLQHHADGEVVGVDVDALLDLLRLGPRLLHVVEVDLLPVLGNRQPLIQHLHVVEPLHARGHREGELVERGRLELGSGPVQQVGQVDGLDDRVGEDHPQPHGHLAVVEVHHRRLLPLVHFLPSLHAMRVPHVLVVHLYHVLAVVQTEGGPQVGREDSPANAVVVKQVVLLAALAEVDLELRVLLLLAKRDQLAHDVPEDLLEPHPHAPLLGDLEEHVLQPHHEERHLLEGELHHLDHNGQEVLHAALPLRQSLELPPKRRQLLLEDQPADLRGRVLLERFVDGPAQELLSVVQRDSQSLVAVDDPLECQAVLALPLLLQLTQHLHLLLLGLTHDKIIKKKGKGGGGGEGIIMANRMYLLSWLTTRSLGLVVAFAEDGAADADTGRVVGDYCLLEVARHPHAQLELPGLQLVSLAQLLLQPLHLREG